MQIHVRRLFVGIAVLGLVACERGPAQEALPDGTWLVGRAEALDSLLRGVEGFRDSPLAVWAARARQSAASCGVFVAHAPPDRLDLLPDRLRCQSGEPLPPVLVRLQGKDDLAFVIPLAGGARLMGSARLDAKGGAQIRARIEALPANGIARLMVPAATEPGPARLGGGESLLHARFRPVGGLDLANRIAAGGQADRLFRLKSRIFAGAVLAGAWELAIYSPRPGRSTLGVALGLDVAFHAAARTAMEEFVSRLEETWPISHTPSQFGDHTGACFFDLHILPEFAPCYALTDVALVFGWNPESIQLALASDPEPELGDVGGLVVHLDRLPKADEQLRAAATPDAPSLGFEYAWRRLSLHTQRSGRGVGDDLDALHFQIELIAGRESS
jgi:hypothetical protein